MPSGFKTFGEEEFDRVFMKETEIIDNFVGERLWSWGSNTSGRLGDGTTTGRSSPGTTAGGIGLTWKDVVGSPLAGAGIKTDGTLWTWGAADYGVLGTGNASTRSSPGTTAGGGTNWKQVSCAYGQMAAVKTDGTLWTWGRSGNGVLGDGTFNNRSSPGTTEGGGNNWKEVSTNWSPSSTTVITAAIKTDGTLWTWGENFHGGIGDNSTTIRRSPVTTAGGGTNWKTVGSGGNFVFAIKTDGTLWSWGRNNYGQLGTSNTTDRSSPGTTVGGGTNWKQVACGYGRMAAIKTDGTLWTCGYNGSGQLGDGTTTSRLSPITTAGGGTNWKQVGPGYGGVSAIKTDGTLWTWGNNNNGQLGDGTTNNRSSPGTTSGGGNNWKFTSSGHLMAGAITDQTI
jgi:alpha-tubulin suppressor-like RCC1 family protein